MSEEPRRAPTESHGETADVSDPHPDTQKPTSPVAIIIDIDGTIALRGDRDQPNWPIIELVQILRCYMFKVLFVSGRQEKARADTLDWLMELFPAWEVNSRLFMRADGDVRQDSVVKREIYEREIAGTYEVRWVFDDRQQAVDMWRSIGLTVLRVASGDF